MAGRTLFIETKLMNIKSVAKLSLVYSGCFWAALLVGVVGFIKGYLSPRALGIFLALVNLAGVAFLTTAFRRLARKNATQGWEAETANPSKASRKRQLFLIKMYKAWIVFLMLCLVGGVVRCIGVRSNSVAPDASGNHDESAYNVGTCVDRPKTPETSQLKTYQIRTLYPI